MDVENSDDVWNIVGVSRQIAVVVMATEVAATAKKNSRCSGEYIPIHVSITEVVALTKNQFILLWNDYLQGYRNCS